MNLAVDSMWWEVCFPIHRLYPCPSAFEGIIQIGYVSCASINEGVLNLWQPIKKNKKKPIQIDAVIWLECRIATDNGLQNMMVLMSSNWFPKWFLQVWNPLLPNVYKHKLAFEHATGFSFLEVNPCMYFFFWRWLDKGEKHCVWFYQFIVRIIRCVTSLYG